MPQNQRSLTESSNNFPVAGIGASAGGLDAFRKLLSSIPENSGIAYVLVQHLDPNHESILPELLQKSAKIPVQQITDDIEVKPDNIYIIPSNKMLLANDGILKLKPRPPAKKDRLNLPIDLFFKSLAEVHQSYSLGVVLSGTGSDGTEGLKAIKEKGGISIAQDEDSAQWPDMPRNAIKAGVVDFILKPEDMPAKIMELRKKLVENDGEDGKDGSRQDRENIFRQILALIRIRKTTDFTFYKQTTVRRRIVRRMAITKNKDIESYLDYLRDNRDEQDNLYQDLLIPVTSFFREPETFEHICNYVLPSLIANKKEDSAIRIWIAGCSTGEEAYSFAICLREYLNNNFGASASKEGNPNKNLKVQIFATDISEPAIGKARKGFFSKSAVKTLGSKRLNKFFTKSNGGYLVNQEVREMCIFAVHNFLEDPPFGGMDLISCRNVLIYLQPYLQKKALTTFHYALNKKGYLLLGKSESGSGMTDYFEPTDKDKKLYKRKDIPERLSLPSNHQQEKAIQNENYRSTEPQEKLTDFQKAADDLLIKKYVPASVVVNENFDIVLFRGETDPYLGQQSGKPSHNLLKKAKGALAFELRRILHKAKKENAPVKKEDISFYSNEERVLISIEVVPLEKMLDPSYLVIFHPTKPVDKETKKAEPAKKDEKDLHIQQLEQELSQSREDMRAITEDQEATNEELQSTNEELLSGKEELQSLNEELETSKEELQSTNEELTALNQELHDLNDEITEERNFAQAIIKTIREPLLVLDGDLKIISANKSFYSTFKVTKEETEGEKLYDLGNKQWNIPELSRLLETILPENESFTNYEVVHEFESIGKKTMLLNAREILHKGRNRKMILLAIEDVTERRHEQNKTEENLHRYHEMIHSSPSLIAILEGEDFILSIANSAILEHLGKGKNIIGQPLLKAVPELEEQGMGKRLREVYKTGIPYQAHEFPVSFIKNGKEELSYYNFVYQAQKDTQGNIIGVAIIANEVTAQAEFHRKIREKEEKYHQMADLMPDKINSADTDGNAFYFNQSWLNFTGLTSKELQEEGWVNHLHQEEKENVLLCWQKSLNTGKDFEMELRLRDKNDQYVWHLSRAVPVKDDEDNVKLWIAASTEIQKIKEEEKRKGDFLKLVSHELKTPVTSIKGYSQMLLSMLKEEGEIDYKNLPLVTSLERIDNQISRLTRLISEMLDLTRMEEGQLQLQKETFNINQLVEECVQDVSYSSSESKIKLFHQDHFDVYADYDRIGQVLINFITNGIKYSAEDKNMEITVFKNDENKGSVSVRDHGIGIAEKDQQNIFKRFYRVSGKNEETYSGFGIGLFLAKEIINRHGGQIEVQSNPGEGSEFIFSLPMVSEE